MAATELLVELMNEPPSFSQISRTRLTLFARELTRAVQSYKDEQKNKVDKKQKIEKCQESF